MMLNGSSGQLGCCHGHAVDSRSVDHDGTI